MAQHLLAEEEYELDYRRNRPHEDFSLMIDEGVNPKRLELEAKSALASFQNLELKDIAILKSVYTQLLESSIMTDVRVPLEVRESLEEKIQMLKELQEHMELYRIDALDNLDEGVLNFHPDGTLSNRLETTETIIASGQIVAYMA